jgi:hypothetical protein
METLLLKSFSTQCEIYTPHVQIQLVKRKTSQNRVNFVFKKNIRSDIQLQIKWLQRFFRYNYVCV